MTSSTITWPDHLVLAGLEQTDYGFIAYLRVKGQFYLQGGRGPDAQTAINRAAERITQYYSPPASIIDADFLSDL